ncbi:MAG: Aspartyl/glutamyl-tRNA(Asn/Gln) amidotransferase subunit B [Candidatus Syntrophoarchaeum sp. GoM_oil]|nr:MAG: Aspartyl/glutamyl-tRNA(Asn/Gln) amidotransferase subunit B [Candidatus Syntrophoarchaeum sp. GoM_oil]
MVNTHEFDVDVMIGLECHVQLNKLNTKLFCPCSSDYQDDLPNTHTCPVCLGLPGALPVINRKAVEYGIKVALALNCTIQEETLFYRKNYYYPDLPRGFQISQYDFPLSTGGVIYLDGDVEREIRINRVHMEEDPGRLVHRGAIEQAQYTMVDYNRSGMPLLEIVTEPDLKSPQEARQFLNKIRNILEYLDVFDGDLDGSLRVDANLSIEGGQRAEVKNISSYKGAEKALLFEIMRQKNVLRRGKKVVQETRHFDEARGITISMRTKEEEHDYRYFPEPDLVVMRVGDWVKEIEKSLPELPDAKRDRFLREYEVSQTHAKVLTSDIHLANFFEEITGKIDPAFCTTWIADILKGELNYRGIGLDRITQPDFIDLMKLLESDEITDHGAIEVIRTILDNGGDVRGIVQEKGLLKAKIDETEIAVNAVIEEFKGAVSDYQSGKREALNFLVGQVMRKTRGRSDPDHANKLLLEQIGKLGD